VSFRDDCEELYGPGWPDAPDLPAPNLSMEARCRALMVLFKKAATVIEMPSGMRFPSYADFLQHVLERAREHDMDAGLYSRLYGLHRVFREFPVPDREVSL
jgi:hypothetical protein